MWGRVVTTEEMAGWVDIMHAVVVKGCRVVERAGPGEVRVAPVDGGIRGGRDTHIDLLSDGAEMDDSE
jgi:hypothetical protein